MKFLKLISALLIVAAVLTGCVQINVPPAQKDETEVGEPSTDRAPVSGELESEAETLPSEPILEERYSVVSTESEDVILRVDLRAKTYDGKTAEVSVGVYISYGKLSKGRSTGTVTLNGETKTFSVRAIENRLETSRPTINPANFTFTVPLDKLDGTDLTLVAVWDLGETVGGEYVETLSASATFPFWVGSEPADESATNGSETAATPKMISETCE